MMTPKKDVAKTIEGDDAPIYAQNGRAQGRVWLWISDGSRE